MEKEKIIEALKKALEDKGKRKFTQTMEFILNFKGVDFSKPENRISLDVQLPHEVRKTQVVVIADDKKIVSEAKNAGLMVISWAEFQNYTKGKVKEMAKSTEYLVEPKLMAEIGKKYRFLAASGKLRPFVNPKIASSLKNLVHLRSKGKYIPTLQCAIGNENMEVEKMSENILAVVNAIKSKVSEDNFKSAYVKLTMGKPVEIEIG